MTISFKDKVAIVTGAGGGLGRAYALELARRGAKVVVNDLGGARDGTGHSDAALAVVEEIKAAGGQAMSNGGNVAEHAQMEELVAKAKEAWGTVHILINNAGILRDKTFAKMDPADFELVVRVHLLGSAFATKAVWETMREQNYGRILMTTSSSGIGGNFGQANYSAAKLGVVGLAKTLHLEGAKYNIRVNSLAPTAGTRMTEDIFPEEAFKAFSPENVAPAALFLVSDDAPSNAIVARRRRRLPERLCHDERRRAARRRRAHGGRLCGELGENQRAERRCGNRQRHGAIDACDGDAGEGVAT